MQYRQGVKQVFKCHNCLHGTVAQLAKEFQIFFIPTHTTSSDKNPSRGASKEGQNGAKVKTGAMTQSGAMVESVAMGQSGAMVQSVAMGQVVQWCKVVQWGKVLQRCKVLQWCKVLQCCKVMQFATRGFAIYSFLNYTQNIPH